MTRFTTDIVPDAEAISRLTDEVKQLQDAVDTWQTMIESIIADYQCR